MDTFLTRSYKGGIFLEDGDPLWEKMERTSSKFEHFRISYSLSKIVTVFLLVIEIPPMGLYHVSDKTVNHGTPSSLPQGITCDPVVTNHMVPFPWQQ